MMAWCMWSLMLFYSLSPWVLICHRADQDAIVFRRGLLAEVFSR